MGSTVLWQRSAAEEELGGGVAESVVFPPHPEALYHLLCLLLMLPRLASGPAALIAALTGNVADFSAACTVP